MPERSEHGQGASPGLPTVAYQGVPGSYSYDACGEAEPDRYPGSGLRPSIAAVSAARVSLASIRRPSA